MAENRNFAVVTEDRRKGADFGAVPAPRCPPGDVAIAPVSAPVAALRRLLDIVVSASALLLLSPVFAVIAVLIALDSPGPALFRHRRVGINRRRAQIGPPAGVERRRQAGSGKPFTLYKFRSMYTDARERFPHLYAYKYTDEELVTLPIKILVGTKRDPEAIEGAAATPDDLGNDPRITRVGRWLRRTSLDELPNFWNVLKGDMHLVGPRPDIEENICYYTVRGRRKLEVKPGITGLSQIKGRGTLTFHEINELDFEFVATRSLRMDLRILARTISVVLRGTGAA